MSEAPLDVKRAILVNAINWFSPQFGQALVFPFQSHFPIWALPGEIEAVVHWTSAVLNAIQEWQGDPIRVQALLEKLGRDDVNYLRLFKRCILQYRRHRAAETELLTEKRFHPHSSMLWKRT